MANLKEIQEALNKDPEELKKFQADPVGYLEAKGLVLPDDAKQHLIDSVKKNQNTPGAVWNVGVQLGPKN
jgi:hypothetical protein